MRAKRWRGRGIDLFLWVCPLVGVGVFVGAVLHARFPPAGGDDVAVAYFDLPGAGGFFLLAAALLFPLIVALLSRRLLGFLAAACLLLLVVAGVGWIRSHRASDNLCWLGAVEGPPHWHDSAAAFISSGGGCSLELYRTDDELRVRFARQTSPAAGRHQALGYTRWSPRQSPPSEGGDYATTPAALRRWGFAVAINPKPEERIDTYDVPFAVALPYWFLCLLAIPLPLAWTIRLRRRRRVARRARLGLCRACGYDLRATPDAGGALLAICPECGALAQSEQPSARSTG